MEAVLNQNGEGALVNGAGLENSAGTDCCCGGSGGNPHWLYLRKYCSPNDCNGWIKIWSETPYGDGRTWGQAFGDDRGFSCPYIIKIGEVCFVARCPGTMEQINCPDDQIKEYDGPGTTAVYYHWRDRLAACGPCCGDIQCFPRLWASCDPVGTYHCIDLGREFTVNYRYTADRTVELTQPYLAFLNSGLSQNQQCWQSLEQHQRCNHSNITQTYLKLFPNGCYEPTGRCLQDHYDSYQTSLNRALCRYDTINNNFEFCNGQEVGIPDASASAFGAGLDLQNGACGFIVRLGPTGDSFLRDSTGCAIKAGSHTENFPGSRSWFRIDWTFYEDGHFSRFSFNYEAHDYCLTTQNPPVEIECQIERISVETIYQFQTDTPCQPDDQSQCNGPRPFVVIQQQPRMNPNIRPIRQTVDNTLGTRINSWLGIDWIGEPMPVRVWKWLVGKRVKPQGCGCMRRPKTAWVRFSDWLRGGWSAGLTPQPVPIQRGHQ